MEANCAKHGDCTFLTTESVDKFKESAELFLGIPIEVKQVVLD